MRYRFMPTRSSRGLTAPIGGGNDTVRLCSYADRETDRSVKGS